MKQQLLAQRYAKALFELAVERDELDSILVDLKAFVSTLNQSEDLQAIFVNPVYALESREAIVKNIAEKMGLG